MRAWRGPRGGGLVPKENLGFYLFLRSLCFYLYQEGVMVEP